MTSSFERISKRSSPIALALVLVGSGLALTPDALAGRFHVYSCRTPAGQAAPVDGWSGSKSGTYTTAENTCSQPGGALVAGMRNALGRTANTDYAAWSFGPSASETLAAATVWRAGDAAGGAELNASYEFWLAGAKSNQVFDSCTAEQRCLSEGNPAQPLSAGNVVLVPNANLGGRLYATASCGGVSEYRCPETKEDANGYAAVVYLYAADLTIEQNAGPSATAVGGELAVAPTVAGTSDVAFSATDPGAGVYEAVFNVDGQVVQRTVVDENGGRCRDVGETSDGTPAFLYLQPCLGSVSADIGLDTTKIADGSHHLIVDVVDAAGNMAPVLDRQITVANAVLTPAPLVGAGFAVGPPNGVNASPAAALAIGWGHIGRVSVTSRYGRAQTVVGRLTAPGGAPISGAQLELQALPASPGAKPIVLAPARTAADGSFAVRLPVSLPSCALSVSYRAHIGDTLPAVTRMLRLSVHAGVVLTIAPRSVVGGQSIFFRGRLLGHLVPRGGKQLVLEARSPGGRWIEFQVVRTDARGRYRSAYRFRFAGPARYQFRVLSEPEADYPFAAGSSRIVPVRER
jgi:hypothetical protein